MFSSNGSGLTVTMLAAMLLLLSSAVVLTHANRAEPSDVSDTYIPDCRFCNEDSKCTSELNACYDTVCARDGDEAAECRKRILELGMDRELSEDVMVGNGLCEQCETRGECERGLECVGNICVSTDLSHLEAWRQCYEDVLQLASPSPSPKAWISPTPFPTVSDDTPAAPFPDEFMAAER